ncbi:MAG TPA: terminase, partial [Plesiomonas shigelloides]|nr:terminase [Plesiomonas shigelloides]
MAKHDWKALQAEFLEEHRESGITAQEWCSQRGINYQSARRYIKVRNVETAQLHQTAQSAQNRTAQSTSTAHSAVSAQKQPKTGRTGRGDEDEGGVSDSASSVPQLPDRS